ncbi:ArdC-like ssDNA-binding domain-containing protein [Lactococcus petauri]|uniref:ArdC-like ssDNA-binding domain-containing protein n=1 Tax=Lactococcus petauri TaxID=1940789 RepID=UPI0038555F2D
MDKEINSGTIVFDFEQLSKEVFKERASSPSNKPNWEDLVSKDQTYNMDRAFNQFVEDVKNSKENYISDHQSKEAKEFDEQYFAFFYEGGKVAYDKAVQEGNELTYNSSTIDIFVDMYETYLNKLKKNVTVNADPKITEIIKDKNYKELSNLLKEGIKDYLKSDVFKNYLRFISKFHKYSEKNIRLILMQNENASHVASFKKWKEMDNPVKKGEKAIYIYAPRQKVKKDKDGEILRDEEGKPLTETYFILVPTYDVSQTISPEKLPQPVYALPENFENPNHFHEIYKGLCSISPVPVTLENIPGDTEGYYNPREKRIAIQRNQGEEMTIRTLIHEITHAYLHTNSGARFGDEVYSRQELEAESVAYIVSSHLGIDASSYSFGYLSSWTDKGNKLEDFQESLQTLAKQSELLITKIEETLNKTYGITAPQNEFEKRLKEAREPKVERSPAPQKKAKNETEEVSTIPKAHRPLMPLPNGR